MPRLAVRFLVSLCATFLLATAGGSSSSAEPEAPSEVVDRLHGVLIEIMKRADELGYQGRRAELAPTLESSFDLEFMARLAIGRGWRQLGDEERARWLGAFKELSLATYAARFDGFSGQRFETEGVEEASHDTKLVKTRIVLTDDDPVEIDYRVRSNGHGWRIIDVYLNGTVSEVALRRSEFSAVLERHGFDALVAQLEEKIESYAQGPASPASM